MRDRWVKFADKKPPVWGKYLYLAPSADPWEPLIGVGWYDPDTGSWELVPEYWAGAITHWMFLPGFPYEVRARARLADRNEGA